jgi:hypothetical protein
VQARTGATRLLTRSEVVTVLGEIDETVISDLIGTGATADELAEARAWIVNDEPLLHHGKPLASGRVSRLVDILAAMHDEETGRAGRQN